eukprot:gb/GEZN01003692.1/.p1 GENE.gb/GEZN01003692.1/~~gb/GEZN01003692.1/.p1  ORF type:complete len:695 (-),score=82.46 gb/GEZN01003692.1/:30-2060(-)
MTEEVHRKIPADFIRENWIESQLQARISEFTDLKPLYVFTGTWNVNAKRPKEDLSSWLLVKPSPDIYVIGFQELVDLNNASNLIVEHTALNPWMTAVEATIPKDFYLATSTHLVGLGICVFIKNSFKESVSDIQLDTVGVGVLGVGGNKGAVVARFKVYDSSMCFVNTHLAAHKGNVQGRNSNYHTIIKKIQFQAPGAKNGPPRVFGLMQHNHIFWIGDLNYRLNLSDVNEVYEKVDQKEWAYLATHDQLVREKKTGNAFAEFKEGTLDFPPTYKYVSGTNQYAKEGKKVRMPAWTDRIQWAGDHIKQISYTRAELMVSDHKPVSSLFSVEAQLIVPEKRKEVCMSLTRQLDTWENENIPKVKLSAKELFFPQATFDVPETRTLLIENVGKVNVLFLLIPKLEEEKFCKPWLNVTPEFGMIPPGKIQELSVTLHVTRETGHALNIGKDMIEDILIIRLENGRDYFVTIAGEYFASCFGATIDYLVNAPYPVRFVEKSRKTQQTPTTVLSMPKELWRLVDYIWKNGMGEPGLFVTAGDPAQIAEIRDALDTGQPFKVGLSIHSMAEAFIQMLESLHQPVFPSALVDNYVSGLDLSTWCKQALMQLSPSHYNVFVYVISFLREVLKHKDQNELSDVQLVLAFSNSLFHDGSNLGGSAHKEKFKSWVVLQHLLNTNEFI